MKKSIFCLMLILLMLCGCSADKNENRLLYIKSESPAVSENATQKTENKAESKPEKEESKTDKTETKQETLPQKEYEELPGGTAEVYTDKDGSKYAENSVGTFKYDHIGDAWIQIDRTNHNEDMLKIMKGEDLLTEWASEKNSDGYDEYYIVLKTAWNTLRLDDECAKEYPVLASTLEDMRMTYNAYENDYFYSMIDSAKQWCQSKDQGHFSRESKMYIQRSDSKILSIREDVYQFDGGMRPYYETVGINIDPTTGEIIMLSDIVRDMNGFAELLGKKVTEKYPELDAGYVNDAIDSSKIENYNWTMDYSGITFYFNAYEILPGSLGTQIVRLRFDELSGLVDKKYTSVPEHGYAVEVPLNEEYELDYGTMYINTMLADDEYEWYNGFVIEIDGTEYSQNDLSFYSLTPYCIHFKDGRTFLYIELISENDYKSLLIYDISYGFPNWIDQIYGTGFDSEYYEDDDYFCKDVLTDPSDFDLITRIDVLGTNSGIRNYYVDPTYGTLSYIDETYDMGYDGLYRIITTLAPLEAKDLSTGEMVTIPKGTEVEFIRTDNSDYAVLQLKDGSECRVNIDVSEYPVKINGIPEYECFDGLLYAG